MKKNYNLLPKEPHSFLWRPGGSEKPDEGNSIPAFAKKSSLLIAAMLFMFTTVQTFAQTSYCTPAPESVDNQGIINITIGTINNTTATETGNYGNFSAQIVNIGQSVIQPFSITYATGYDYNTKIWVDWNNDFDFTDEGEQVYYGISSAANPTTLFGTFTVPATATLGNHRLRIGGLDDGGDNGINVTPCYNGTYGSFEDYTINVTLPPTCFTPANAAAVVTGSNNANLSWAAPTLGTTPVGYEYAVDTNTAAPASGVGTTATSVTGYTGFADSTNYYLHVRTNCGNGSYSDWITSQAFRYVGGDTCATAISLESLTSPLSSTTAGAANNYTASCNFSSAQTPDLFYSIVVPVGYKLSIGQTANNYDSVHSAFYGTCESSTAIVCYDYPEVPADGTAATLVWENTTGSTQTVYWVQDSYNAAGGTFTLAWSLVPPPACNIPTAVTAQLLSTTQANLSWGVPVTSTPIGYEYAVTNSATAPASGTPVTGTTVTGVTVTASQTNYLYVRTSCGNNEFSTWVSYPFFAGYCTPAPTSVDGTGITNVTIGSINNTSAAETGNYGDYTAQVVNIGQGVAQPFSITYRTNSADYVTRIWIDWNNDLNFNDEGEQVFAGTSASTNPAVLTGIITVPTTATLGSHRMRIGGVDFGNIVPCYTGTWGSFEDYTVNVTTPPACFVPANALGAATASGVANLSWTAPVLGTTPVGYEYAVDTNTAAPASGTLITTTSVTGYEGIVDGTFYYLHVRTNCGNGSFSEWITSPAFRYLQGDTCATAISLDALTSPLSSTTVGAGNDYTPTCSFSNAPDLFYSIVVPVGYKLSIGQTANNYDDVHAVFYGDCSTNTLLLCADYPELPSEGAGATLLWENTTASTQTVYWVQDGYNLDNGTFTLAWTLTPPPACNVPTAVAATLTNTTTATVSWAGPITGTATGYEYAVTNSDTAPASGTATTETSITGVTISVNIYSYLYVRTKCGENEFSEWVSVRFYSGYCIPAPTSVDGTGITNVTIGSINNDTVDEPGHYGNYTAQVVNIGQGVAQPFSITYRTNGADYVTKIWIDWNDDLDFDDAGEEVYAGTSAATNPAILTGIITIPDTAPLGNHRMRIGGTDFGPTTACYNGSWGSFEDYTVNVTIPPVCFTPSAVTAVNASAGFVNISWTAPTLGTAPSGYEYVVDTTVGAPAVSGIATTETSVANVAAPLNVTGYLHVRTNCGNDNYSEWVTVSFYNGVCIPAPTNVDGIGITNVAIGSINNTTGDEPGHYGNYSAQVVNVGQGVTQAFDITFSTGYTYDTKIWVDWNDDLDFDDAGEQVYYGMSAADNPTVLSGTFTVPANATLGNHRLRIGGLDSGGTNGINVTPCYTGSFGSYEDYTINVTTPPSCFTPTNAVGVTTASNTANLSWTAPTLGETPVSYEYVVDTTTATPTVNGAVVTTTSVTGYTGLVDNTYYYLHVRTNCGEGGYSEWITSPRFRYLLGDTCNTAINLDNQTGTYSFSTTGAGNDFTPTCSSSNAPDVFHAITVLNGYTISIGQTANDYDSLHSAFYGTCDNRTSLLCSDYPELPADGAAATLVWENTTGSTQTIYWVQDGWGTASGAYTLAWTLVGPVSCDKPRDLVVQLTSLTTANLEWRVPNTGSPQGYEYAVTTSATPPASGTFTAETTVTGVTVTPNVALYLHVRSICSATDTSIWVTIPFFSGYCVPTNTSAGFYITSITTTGALTNVATTSPTFSAFTDYTATQTVTSYAGGIFEIQATSNTAASYIYSVWVDWNNDFDFDDEGERVITTDRTTSSSVSLGELAIPVNAVQGTYRMRIRNANVGSPVPACGDAVGEAEDYTLVIAETPSCLPPYNLTIEPADTGFANLRWSPSLLSVVPVGYEYVFGPSATAPTGNGTVVNIPFAGDVPYNSEVSVYLFVRSICGTDDYSEWTPASILDVATPKLLANNVIAYKDGNSINITSQSAQITGVSIYDTRGRKLYDQSANNNDVVISDLQIQQQVIILEIKTTKGTVSKRIIF